jgi:hypothetical protein
MKRKTVLAFALLTATLPASASADPYFGGYFDGFKICTMHVSGPWNSFPAACLNGALEKVFG